MQLICAFVFEYAKSRVSHDTARTESGVVDLLNCDYINPADGRPIYRPIKCQILALISSADKK